MRKLSGEALITLDTSTATCTFPTFVKGSLLTGVVIQRCRSTIRGEIIRPKPILPQYDGVDGEAADMFDEAGEMEGDLRVGCLVGRTCWRDRRCFADAIDFYDPRRNGPLCRLPDERSGKAGGEEQTTKGHQAPIPGLDTRRADPV